jgi:2-oxoglutarate ferredoxin oxidoreductase subunit delta
MPEVVKEPSPDRRQWHYPDASEHPDEEVYIHIKWCKSCGICYSMCPQGVFTSDKSGLPVVSNPEACTVCGLCEMLCPDMAITVHKKRQKKADAGKRGDE